MLFTFGIYISGRLDEARKGVVSSFWLVVENQVVGASFGLELEN
jgi:hypothetical protein